MVPAEWLGERYRPAYQPGWVYEASLWRGLGYVSFGAGLAPGYLYGAWERGARAGYWPAPEGAEPWTYAGRMGYYEQRAAGLAVSPSLFWAGYRQARYGEEIPGWIPQAFQRYDVSRAYWEFQQAWTPMAELWTGARLATYAFPEAWPLRAFGYGFYGAAQRLGAAAAVAPYAQGMTPEQLGWTSAGWAFQYPTWPEWFGASVLEWTGMQVASWAGMAALGAGLGGAGLRGALGAGWASLRGAAGISLMQPGLDILLENLGVMGARYIAGQPVFATPQEQAQALTQMAVGAGLIGAGAAYQYAGLGDLAQILGPQGAALTGAGRFGLVGAQALGYFAGYYPTRWAAEQLGATPEQAVLAGWGVGQFAALGAGALARGFLPQVARLAPAAIYGPEWTAWDWALEAGGAIWQRGAPADYIRQVTLEAGARIPYGAGPEIARPWWMTLGGVVSGAVQAYGYAQLYQFTTELVAQMLRAPTLEQISEYDISWGMTPSPERIQQYIETQQARGVSPLQALALEYGQRYGAMALETQLTAGVMWGLPFWRRRLPTGEVLPGVQDITGEIYAGLNLQRQTMLYDLWRRGEALGVSQLPWGYMPMEPTPQTRGMIPLYETERFYDPATRRWQTDYYIRQLIRPEDYAGYETTTFGPGSYYETVLRVTQARVAAQGQYELTGMVSPFLGGLRYAQQDLIMDLIRRGIVTEALTGLGLRAPALGGAANIFEAMRLAGVPSWQIEAAQRGGWVGMGAWAARTDLPAADVSEALMRGASYLLGGPGRIPVEYARYGAVSGRRWGEIYEPSAFFRELVGGVGQFYGTDLGFWAAAQTSGPHARLAAWIAGGKRGPNPEPVLYDYLDKSGQLPPDLPRNFPPYIPPPKIYDSIRLYGVEEEFVTTPGRFFETTITGGITYRTGGRFFEAQQGLDRVFTERTTIQVAEAGPEHVKVTPLQADVAMKIMLLNKRKRGASRIFVRQISEEQAKETYIEQKAKGL